MSPDEALQKIVSVMRQRGEPEDWMLSEIQDYLTMAGFDVPLRSYRVTPPDAPDAPRDREWVKIASQIEGQYPTRIHHRHNSVAACAACEIESLRAETARLREALEHIVANEQCEVAKAGVSPIKTCLDHHIVVPCPYCIAKQALGASRPGEPQP